MGLEQNSAMAARVERRDEEASREWMDRPAAVLEQVTDEEQNAAALEMAPWIHEQSPPIDRQHGSADHDDSH